MQFIVACCCYYVRDPAKQCHYYLQCALSWCHCHQTTMLVAFCCCGCWWFIVACHQHYCWYHCSTLPLLPLSLCSAMAHCYQTNICWLYFAVAVATSWLSSLSVPLEHSIISNTAFTVSGLDSKTMLADFVVTAVISWLLLLATCHCHSCKKWFIVMSTLTCCRQEC